MEKKFSFVKHLTKRDVEKIVENVGLEIDVNREDVNGNPLNPLMRGTDEDGRSYIMAFCVDNKKIEETKKLHKYMYENSPAFREFSQKLAILSGALAGFGGFSDNPYSAMNGKVMLRFDDFTLTECFSLKPEQEELEFDRMMTGIYQNYMVEKFGRFYNNMKAGYIRTLNMEEKKKAKEENTPENEQEME